MLPIPSMPEMMNPTLRPALSVLALAVFLATGPSQGDEIKLKSGETISGRITYEADDIVKIEVAVSASIKETKVLGRAEIASIVKDAPDDVEFNKLQGLVPTGSLVPVDAYRKMLETGPDTFLRTYPDSKHVPKVKEIRATLADELDKVERGNIKLEGEWLSPQDKIDFKELIDSRVRFLRMESYAKGGNYASYIAAMREFEVIEETYFGSPAFPKAVELANQIVPDLGRQLQTMASNVDFQTAEYERALEASTPEARVQLTAARAREDKSFTDSIAADKKVGVKWVQLNPRNKQAITDYLKLASAELTRIRAYDAAALALQAEQLVAVDKLIATDQITEAKTKLSEAAAMGGQKVDTKSKSKSKGSSKAGSYIAALNGKINDRIAEETEKAKAQAAASDSQALTENLRKSKSGDPAEKEAKPEEGAEADPSAATEVKPEIDEFSALASSSKKKDSEEPSKEKSSSKKSKATKSSSSDDDSEEDEDGVSKPRPAPVVEEEGGFPFGLIVPILTVLLIITVVAMKVLGIGGKKEED